jgi:hypothetical protein
MANAYRNEKEIQLGPYKILLRPTFEAIANLEAHVGPISDFAVQMSKSKLPKLTDMAKIVYHCQCTIEGREGKLTLEEIWDAFMQDGITVAVPVLSFLSVVTAGDKTKVDLTDNQKKS